MNKLIYKLRKRFFCYWCYELEGKHRLGRHYGRYAVDSDYSNEDNQVYPIHEYCCMCKNHYEQWQNNEGIYEPEG